MIYIGPVNEEDSIGSAPAGRVAGTAKSWAGALPIECVELSRDRTLWG